MALTLNTILKQYGYLNKQILKIMKLHCYTIDLKNVKFKLITIPFEHLFENCLSSSHL